MYIKDTIAAIATPIGEGAIGIIRLSGPEAKSIALTFLYSSRDIPFTHLANRHVYYAKAMNPYNFSYIDEVLFFFSPAPNSYTGEDVVEIQAHGGTYILSKLLEVCLSSGARQAEPGEFTKRAFFNQRIDLVQAESIIDLIRAKTEKAHELALSQLSGTLSRMIQQLETKLYHILITLEALLDFPEEGIPDLQKNVLDSETALIEDHLKSLLANFNEGRIFREGLAVAIIGRPNVGKSSFFNTFLEEERAIVTAIPGTTRDLLEVQFQLQGLSIRLIDTAGLRKAENIIENIGIQKAKQAAQNADLLLLMFDGSCDLSESDHQIINEFSNQKKIILISKTDLPQKLTARDFPEKDSQDVVEISLINKKGFSKLQDLIIAKVGLGMISVDDRPLLSRIRHQQALQSALTALHSFRIGLVANLSEDLLAIDLRDALESIGSITGKTVSDEVIQGIFSQFCIGK